MEGGLADDDERIGSKRGRDEKESNIGVGRLEKRPSGIVLMEEYSYSYSGDEMINGVKYEEEKETSTPSGSLFNQLISNFVSSPRSNQHAEANHVQSENKNDGKSREVDGGQLDEKDKDADGDGLVDDIVAHLPTTLSEDAATATDEASILIHSIIHD